MEFCRLSGWPVRPMGVERGGEPSGGEGGGARDDLGSLEDDLAGTGPMQTREEISSRPWRSAIARLTVEAGNRGPSPPGNGRGRCEAESDQAPAVMNRRAGTAELPA